MVLNYQSSLYHNILSAPNSQVSFGSDVDRALAELSEVGRSTLIDVIADRDQRIARLELELKLREEQLRLARIEKYGPKGEKLSQDQVMLLNLEPAVQAEEVAKEAALPEVDKRLERASQTTQRNGRRYSKTHPGRTPLPAHLPRREVIIPCDEASGGELIGYEVKEELVVLPAEFYVQVLKREKRLVRASGGATILTAPMPARIVEKGQLGNSAVVELIIAKFCDHLPIYRQMRIWQRDHGLVLDEALAGRHVLSAGRLLEPLARFFGQKLKEGEFIQADETRVPVLQQEGKGRNDTAWFWQYSKPGGLVYFDYQDSRSRAGPSHFLNDFKGRLQTDGYEVYTALGLKLQSHAGCWAHARRKFDQARKAAPKEAPCQESQEVLDLIAKLYAVESEARDAQLAPQARLQLRQERGVPAQLDALAKRVIQIRQQALPACLLAKACDYLLTQWKRFCVFAADGVIEIDNNWCENGMRPIALGRKNWMHLGTQHSGPPVAAIMTVLASAQRAGVNIRLYLAHCLEKLADRSFTTDQIHTLLPENWNPQTP
jgi:transposase